MHITGIFLAREDQDFIERTADPDLRGTARSALPRPELPVKFTGSTAGSLSLVVLVDMILYYKNSMYEKQEKKNKINKFNMDMSVFVLK